MRSNAEMRQIVDIFVQSLRNLGITPTVTLLDAAQYVERTNNYQFDMTWYERGLSLSPGNEQALYWGTASADQEGSKNWMGVRSPAVDAMIAEAVNATDLDGRALAAARADLEAAGAEVIALGRPLLDLERAESIGPALAAGNCVVLKPPEWAPLTASLLADIAHEAGLPAGVFNVVQGTGVDAGAPLTAVNTTTGMPPRHRVNEAGRSSTATWPPSASATSSAWALSVSSSWKTVFSLNPPAV